jgi:hypothetical protein
LNNEFPSICRACQAFGAKDLSKTWLGHLWREFRDTGIEFEMKLLDISLERLLHRFTFSDLEEQMTALLGDKIENQREKAFRKANTELFVMAECDRLGILFDLGWPAKKYGNSPPFDLRLSVSGILIPVGVKDANGSGLREAENSLEKILTEWVEINGHPPCRIELRFPGAITQKRVTDTLYRTDARTRFRSWLTGHSGIPQESFPILLEDVRLIDGVPQTPPTLLQVFVVRDESAQCQSGGIQSSDALVDVLSNILESHIVEKAEAAHLEDETPFLLFYLQLPNYGASDIKTTAAFRDALTLVSQRAKGLDHSADALWLGSIYVHPKGNSTERYCCLRPGAAWPLGLDPQTLATSISGPMAKL